MKKNIFLIVFSIIISLSCFTNYAIGETYEGDIEKIYRITEDGLVEVSIEEYLKFKDECDEQETSRSNLNSTIINRNIGTDVSGITKDWYRYDESSLLLVRRRDLNRRISRIVDNSRNSSATSLSVGCTTSQGYQINFKPDWAPLSVIKSGVSVSWNNSANLNETYTLNVPDKRYGWWEFEPMMYKSSGYVKRWRY